MSIKVAASIQFKLDNQIQTVLIDTIEDVDLNLSSTITTHPVANGDLIADHMYKEPLSLTLKGTFGINSGTQFTLYSGPQTLGYIQKLFERIKNEAIICKVMKYDKTLGPMYPSGRFLARDNLVLSQINWTEGINTLGFSFTFTEIMIVKYKQYQPNTDDRFLPSIELAEQRSFSQIFLRWEEIDAMVIAIGRDNGLISPTFLKSFQSNFESNKYWFIGGAAGLTAAGIYTAVAIANEWNPAGWVMTALGIAAGAAVVIGIGVSKLIDGIAEDINYRDAVFKNYEEDREKFENFIGQVHIQTLNFVNNVLIYKFDLGNDDVSKSLAVNVYNNYYILDFNKMNTVVYGYDGTIKDENCYSVNVTQYLSGEPVTIRTGVNTFSLPYEFDSCMASQSLTNAASCGYYMFLLKAAKYKVSSRFGGGRGVDGDIVVVDSDYVVKRERLENSYYLIATPLEPTEFWKRLGSIIKNAFERAG